MKYGISKISSGHKTGIIVALIVTFISLIPLFFFLFNIFLGEGEIDLFYLIFYPVAHFFLAYIITRLFLFLYNLIASRVGGIVVELEKIDIEEEDLYKE